MTGLTLQVSLVRDTNTLGTLREMLVLIRLWGQTTPTVLPSITPSAGKIARHTSTLSCFTAQEPGLSSTVCDPSNSWRLYFTVWPVIIIKHNNSTWCLFRVSPDCSNLILLRFIEAKLIVCRYKMI